MNTYDILQTLEMMFPNSSDKDDNDAWFVGKSHEGWQDYARMDERRSSMNITHEERVEFLKAHNDLKNMLMTIHECGDLWISDVRKLEGLEHLLHSILKFVPDTDDEGRPKYYTDYVLEEEDTD